MKRDEMITPKLTVEEIAQPTWGTIHAILQKLQPPGLMAVRLGLIEQLRLTLAEMSKPDATAEMVVKAREYIEALAHLPWR